MPNPAAKDVRLSPLYDVVSTTVYLPRDVPVLKLAKKRTWPDRNTLIEFCKVHCKLDRP